MLARVSSGRWSLWLDTIRAVTVQGHGIGSYFVEMPRFVQDFPIATYRPEYAENEFLHFAFELGVPGVLLLAGIFVRSFLCADGLKLRPIRGPVGGEVALHIVSHERHRAVGGWLDYRQQRRPCIG